MWPVPFANDPDTAKKVATTTWPAAGALYGITCLDGRGLRAALKIPPTKTPIGHREGTYAYRTEVYLRELAKRGLAPVKAARGPQKRKRKRRNTRKS